MPTISQVQIANMALSNVGAKSNIESLTELSAEAKACKLWYDYSLQKALEAFDWSFARRRKNMALDSQDPPDQWSYRYQYPPDCVAFRRIWNPLGDDADAVPFSIETNDNDVRTIVTDQESAVGIFTFYATNTSIYTALFVEALAYQLAHRIALKLTGKRAIMADMLNLFNGSIKNAEAQNANEEVVKPERDAEWIRGR